MAADALRIVHRSVAHGNGCPDDRRALLAASLSGCLGYDGVINHGAVLDQRKMVQVKTGMTAQQVMTTWEPLPRRRPWVATLGTTSASVRSASWPSWPRKSSTSTWPQFISTKRKKVQRISDYGMEDGKPIDFQTRATPTPAPKPISFAACSGPFQACRLSDFCLKRADGLAAQPLAAPCCA